MRIRVGRIPTCREDSAAPRGYAEGASKNRRLHRPRCGSNAHATACRRKKITRPRNGTLRMMHVLDTLYKTFPTDSARTDSSQMLYMGALLSKWRFHNCINYTYKMTD